MTETSTSFGHKNHRMCVLRRGPRMVRAKRSYSQHVQGTKTARHVSAGVVCHNPMYALGSKSNWCPHPSLVKRLLAKKGNAIRTEQLYDMSDDNSRCFSILVRSYRYSVMLPSAKSNHSRTQRNSQAQIDRQLINTQMNRNINFLRTQKPSETYPSA